jgi:hypothetical protein
MNQDAETRDWAIEKHRLPAPAGLVALSRDWQTDPSDVVHDAAAGPEGREQRRDAVLAAWLRRPC